MSELPSTSAQTYAPTSEPSSAEEQKDPANVDEEDMIPETEPLKRIVVIGATGQQGGAVATRLLESQEWDVAILVRAQSRSYTKRLRRLGANVITGNMYDPVSLDRAFHEAFGVFFITDPMTANMSKDNEFSEFSQGKNVVDAAKKAGVKFVVFSAAAVGDDTKVKMFEVKNRVTAYLRDTHVPHCVIRPVFLMDNFNKLDMCCPKSGQVKLPVKETTRIQMVSCLDIADMAYTAFSHPEEYNGQKIELAGDELTGLEIAEAFQNVCEAPMVYKRSPGPFILNFVGGPYGKMMKWMDKKHASFQLDLDAIHELHPTLRKFPDWLRETGWEGKDVGSSERPRKIKWRGH